MNKRRMIFLLSIILSVTFLFSAAAPSAFAAEDNETKIYNYLRSELGCNTATACGILSNIFEESGFDPEAYNPAGYYGLFQWGGYRQSALRSFCPDNYNTIEGQLRYLKHELETNESGAWSMMQGIENTAEGAYTAACRWAQYFERCDSGHYALRGSRAQTVYWPNHESDAAPPEITVQPASVTAGLNTGARFTVEADGSDLTYQWQCKKAGSAAWCDSVSTGNKTAALTVAAIEARDGMEFRCIVQNENGSVASSAATLTVTKKPLISAQPASRTAADGSSVQFTVRATGPDLTYQWQYRHAGSSTWYDAVAPGSVTRTLTVKATEARDGMQFRCVVRNDFGTAVSDAASLTIG